MHRSKRLAHGAAIALLGTALTTACVGEPDQVDLGEPTVDEDAPISAPRFIRSDEPIANQYIVVLAEQRTAYARDISEITDQLALGFSATVNQRYEAALHGFSATMSEEDALALSADPAVAFVEEDSVVYASATQTGATWGLDRIDQASLPLDGNYTSAGNGAGVTVFIVDTGIRTTHNQFGGRASGGFTAINDGNGSNDCNGHGTHVAGTVGGSIHGVAKGANLVAVRVLGCDGNGSNSGVIAGINFVAANAPANSVANMSLGGGASAALDNALNAAINNGVVFVVAAGNENTNACNGSPARVPNAITVGATTQNDARASFSNFGSCVDVLAPGQNITSSSNGSNTATATLSGTSMASPHVAGAAALFRAANAGSTVQQVRDALVNNATPNKLTSLSGSPNKLLVVSFIGGGSTPPPPPPPTPTPPPPSTGTAKTGTASGNVALNTFSHFQPLTVLAGSALSVTMTGTGDPDLYVRFGSQPTQNQFACRPFVDGPSETCSLTVPSGVSQAFISVRGFTAATFTVNASWVEP